MSRSRTRSALSAVLATLGIAAVTLAGSGSAAAGPTRPVKPTVVLVHGAWADAASWTDEIRALERAGYPVLAPPNPLRSLSGDSAYLRAFLGTVPGPIVLAGHSYGGAVISNAATGNPNVRALVFVDAFALAEGQTVFGSTGADSALAGPAETLFDLRPYPGAGPGDADIYLKPAVVDQAFAPDLPRPDRALITATQRPITFAAGSEPSGPPAWATIPSWYLLGTQDRVITPAAQRAMAEQAHAHLVTVRASHVSLLSHPAAVTDLILAAARATS
jgi:pimeloyl-ACP methyl ester carboxylesterase